MVSPVSIEVPPEFTTAERDLLVNIPPGSMGFNLTTGKMDISENGGATPIWKEIQSVNLTTKGDLIAKSSSDVTALSVGGDGDILAADSGELTGLKWNADLKILATKLVTSLAELEFSGLIGASFSPKISMNVVADEAIAVGDILTASTTDFRVRKVIASDPDQRGVIGVALTSAANPGDVISIDGARIVTCSTDTISTVSAGDPIEKSDTQDGKVQNSIESVGTFGIAAQSAGVSSPVKVWLRSNESF
jgi:hypothetical protein